MALYLTFNHRTSKTKVVNYKWDYTTLCATVEHFLVLRENGKACCMLIREDKEVSLYHILVDLTNSNPYRNTQEQKEIAELACIVYNSMRGAI